MSHGTAAMLGMDVGTSSVKALVVSTEGRVLASASAAVTASSPAPGRLEENPQQWWDSLEKAVGMALAALPSGIDIRAVGLSGHMSSLVLLDAENNPLRPCILLADTRGAEEAAEISADVRARIAEQTGNHPSAAFTLAKLLWVRKHEEEIFGKATRAVSAKDYVLTRLTGCVSTEPTDAGNFLLLDANATGWDAKLIESLGLPASLFPPLRAPAKKAGELAGQAAQRLGLRPGVPVVAGGADMACAAVGSGIIAPGDAAMSLGTASPLIVPVHDIHRGLVGKLTFHPHARPGSRYALASILSGGRSYGWLAGLLKEAGASGIDFPSLDQHASRAGLGSDGVLFLPFLTGTGSPDWRVNGRAGWLGLGAATGLAEICRAVLEGVAFNCRECLELYTRGGGRISRIVASGGGAASALWLGIIADVTGYPVQALETPEASALGAAILAAVGCGAFASVEEAASRMVRLGTSILPDTGRSRDYERFYRAYLLAKERTAAVDDALAAARDGRLPS